VESRKTEAQDERICRAAHNLAVLVEEQKVRVRESKQLCLEAMKVLLAHPDFFCTDFNKQLESETELTEEEIKGETIGDSEPQDNGIVEVANDTEAATHRHYLERFKKDINQVIDSFQPSFQREALESILAGLPEKEREWQEEEARDEVRDELINYLHNELPMAEETKVYKTLLAQVKNEKAAAA